MFLVSLLWSHTRNEKSSVTTIISKTWVVSCFMLWILPFYSLHDYIIMAIKALKIYGLGFLVWKISYWKFFDLEWVWSFGPSQLGTAFFTWDYITFMTKSREWAALSLVNFLNNVHSTSLCTFITYDFHILKIILNWKSSDGQVHSKKSQLCFALSPGIDLNYKISLWLSQIHIYHKYEICR